MTEPIIVGKVYVDWDKDYDFTDADEDISAYVTSIEIERAKADTLNAGICTIILLNDDRRFEPNYTSGPYYGNLKLGRWIKVMMNEAGGPYVTEFVGFLEEIVPERIAEEDERQECIFTCYDLLALLEVDKINTGTLIDYGSKELIQLILASIGWGGLAAFDTARFNVDRFAGPGADYNVLDDGQTIYPYCQFEDVSLGDAIRQVIEAEHGDFWMRKDGYAIFEDRHHRIKDRSSCMTFSDAQIAELTSHYIYSDLFNNIDVVSHPRHVGTPSSVIWEGIGETARKINAGESVEYWVSYSDPVSEQPCEAIDLVTPLVATTDYTANQKQDGTGVNMTASVGVTAEQDENEHYKITVTNNASSDIYLTKLQMRGTPLVAFDAVTLNARDNESIAKHFKRTLIIDNGLLSDQYKAQDYANYLLIRHKDQQMKIEAFVLNNIDSLIASHVLVREISDRVTVQSTDHGINSDFFIDGIKLSLDNQSNLLHGEWQLSEAPPDFALFDVDEFDDSDKARFGY